MAKKLNLPSVVGLNLQDISPGQVTFLQAVQDSLNTVDENVVYKDAIDINVPSLAIRASRAQGQTFSVSGTSVASGEDYIALKGDFDILLQYVITLQQYLVAFVDKAAGKT